MFIIGELDVSAVEVEDLAERAKNEGHTNSREVIIRRIKGCGYTFNKKLTSEILISARNEVYKLAANILKKGQEVST